MKKSVLFIAALWLPAVCYGLATIPSGEPTEAGAILNKALKAAGGEARLSRVAAVSMKVKGTFHEDGEKTPFSGEWFGEGYTKARTVLVMESAGVKTKEVRVLNGDKGWTREDDGPTENLDPATLAEERQSALLSWATLLAPLKSKEFKLAPAGDTSVGKRPAVGIVVSRAGYKDIKLFFDKADGLLVKTERASKKDEDEEEQTEEVFFADYRDVQGTRQPMKVTWKYGGKLFCEAEITEMKLLEKLPDSLFTKP